MLWIMFLVCAVVGGTVLVCQFVLTLIGFGGESVDGDADIGGGDVHFDGDASHGGVDHGDSAGDHHLTNWLFGVISLRTIVAAITFFGLCGIAATELVPGSALIQIAAAVLGGLAAMYAVYGVIRLLGLLSHDGTISIHSAVGETGNVYIPIPGGRAGAGKVQLKVEGRLMEYPAVTKWPERLSTGAKVRVVGLADETTVVVEPAAKEEKQAAPEESVEQVS